MSELEKIKIGNQIYTLTPHAFKRIGSRDIHIIQNSN